MKETTVKAILCGMNLETWLLLSTIAVALVIILLVKKRAGEKFTRHEGAIMIVTARFSSYSVACFSQTQSSTPLRVSPIWWERCCASLLLLHF
jgi:ABC-type Mn2+/Zn2+ transport system permease subunit